MIKNIISSMYVLLTCTLLLSCTSQQMYSTLQANKRSECLTLETDSLVKRCLDEANLSFQDYDAERKALLNKE